MQVEEEAAAQPIQPATDPQLPAKLLRAIIVKSFLELLFICVLATYAAFVNFSPLLRGAIDRADQTRVAGWAYDPQAPAEALEVQLFIDDQFVATRRADERRDDLTRAGATRLPEHGYSFDLRARQFGSGAHSIQVYAVRTAAGTNKMLIPLSRQPLGFQVGADQYRDR